MHPDHKKYTLLESVAMKTLVYILDICLHGVFSVMVAYFNPFKPEFTIVIFIHYKPRIAVAILDL